MTELRDIPVLVRRKAPVIKVPAGPIPATARPGTMLAARELLSARGDFNRAKIVNRLLETRR